MSFPRSLSLASHKQGRTKKLVVNELKCFLLPHRRDGVEARAHRRERRHLQPKLRLEPRRKASHLNDQIGALLASQRRRPADGNTAWQD
eukprot:6183325-Pleurochrysis_carterae.AAC.1